MSLAYKQFKVYLRIIVVAVVVALVGYILFKNRNYTVQFWFFGVTDETKPFNVIWLLWWTAGGTLIVARIVWFTRGLVRDYRAIQKQKTEQLAAVQQSQREKQLQERERRVAEMMLDKPASADNVGGPKDTSAQGGAP